MLTGEKRLRSLAAIFHSTSVLTTYYEAFRFSVEFVSFRFVLLVYNSDHATQHIADDYVAFVKSIRRCADENNNNIRKTVRICRSVLWNSRMYQVRTLNQKRMETIASQLSFSRSRSLSELNYQD